jgi:hypothetical protein
VSCFDTTSSGLMSLTTSQTFGRRWQATEATDELGAPVGVQFFVTRFGTRP